VDIKLSFRNNGGLGFVAEFAYNQMVPIPSVGDLLQIGAQTLKIIERAFIYQDQDPQAPRLPDAADIEVRLLCTNP